MRIGLALREAAKSAQSSTLLPYRNVLLELGGRLVEEGRLETVDDVFYLAELDVRALLDGSWDGTGAAELSGDRQRQRERWLERTPPDVILAGELDPGRVISPAHSPRGDSAGAELEGTAVSSGRAEAPAKVVRRPEEGRALDTGDVLVCPSTDPGWTPLFLRASALVMETGGYISHGAIVAREYGIPAVVNVPGILDRVRDGERLLVDGDRGRVVLESAR